MQEAEPKGLHESFLTEKRLLEQISGENLEKRLLELAEIGGLVKEVGKYVEVTRLAFTKEDLAARSYLDRLMKESGMDVEHHPFGLIGVCYGQSPELPAVMLLSHFDSVPKGGMYDGALGTIGAIEVVRLLCENKIKFARTIVVLAATAEESSRFNNGLAGSRALFHGLTDKEICYRQRYVDLIANEETRNMVYVRNHIIEFIRQFLRDRKFLEVETPMMQVIPGGAAAKPFVTHHNALDRTLYLRIAPELYLKRLVVGGFERVFEINRNFRNEGISIQHNPEFTMLEFYQSYANYNDLMDLTETLLREMSYAIYGQTQVMYQGNEIDFGKSFAKMTLKDSILHFNPDIHAADLENLASAKKIAKKRGIEQIHSRVYTFNYPMIKLMESEGCHSPHQLYTTPTDKS